LAYLGAVDDLESFDGDTVVVDIGGGSTELIVGTPSGVAAASLQLGCVRVSERFFHSDPPTPDELEGARDQIAAELERGENVVLSLRRLNASRRLIGLAGTVSTLASLSLQLPEYQYDRLHHSVLSRPDVASACVTLAAMTNDQRVGLPGMVQGREDVILGGALILEQVMSRYGFESVVVSERDILDGIAMGLRASLSGEVTS
jgi:exopolyphosphatase/guanosine-5'-triphosphate,3'-diphosphate pyrophosphatase